VSENFEDVVRAVYEHGVRHDAGQVDRLRRRRNLEPDAAALLSLICQAMGAVRVLEIGTSNGYSTLWLAQAVHDRNGTVLSVDLDADAQRAATTNLARVGLQQHVELRCADGGQVLKDLPDASQDIVLLDSERPEYAGWWPHPVRVLRTGGLLVIDNVLSHADEVADVRALIDADPQLTTAVSPTGKGQLLAIKRPPPGTPRR
jgi:predicted O-methyltransferase YrrM